MPNVIDLVPLARRLVFHEVDPARWQDLERLFESRGGPKHCWCMVWRPMPKGTDRSDTRAKKSVLQGLVQGGTPIGILGYLDGEPVAWCSIAPRSTYRNLGAKDDLTVDPARVWSLVCFFVPRRFRGQGVMTALLQAAVAHAKENGASIVEAYPVALDSHSYRFMGFIPSFEAAGFQEVGMAGTRRHVMRLVL